MNKIKVCHIITKLELGGAQQNTLYTVGHLDRSRFEPVLISGTGGILDREAQLPGVKTYFTKHLVREICPLSDIRALFALWRILVKERPAVVHTHSSKAGIIGRWAAHLARVPVVIHTFHGFGFNDRQKWPVKKAYVYAERFSAPFSDKLIVVSNDNIAKGLENGIGRASQYTVIRSGIDVARYKNCPADREKKRTELNIGNNEKLITTIGPFKPQKNLRDFIKAASLIAAQRKDVRFLIVGDGEQRPQLELLIQGYKLQDKVTLPGWRRDTDEILAASDVFMMTSLWEGLPRSILEAMCAGLPVVANAVDGVKEIVRDGETGFLTQPFAVKDSAERVLTLLADPARAARMGKAGKEKIDAQYDINYMVRQQEELYEALLHADRSKR